MLTKDEKKMLRVVAAYNEATEEQVENAIVKKYLDQLMRCGMVSEMALPIAKEEDELEVKAVILDENGTRIVKQRKKPGPKPKKQTVNEIADEIERAENDAKMTKDEFIEYMSRRQQHED